MKVFAGGISTETNTFSSIPTSREDFLVQRGEDVLEGRVDHPSLNLSAVWGEQAKARGDTFVFSLMAWARPSGTTVRSAYEALRDEMLDDLRTAKPVDVVLLNLYGNMAAQGYEDCKADIVRRVRNVVGPETVIGVELGLHCYLSQSMMDSADVVITYKACPHGDGDDRARQLFELARAIKLGRIRTLV